MRLPGLKYLNRILQQNKELPGATLVVKDKDGNVIDEWVSTSEPHIIRSLTVGKTIYVI